MTIVCEVCKKTCFLIEGEYICEDGHISKYVQEMTESVDFMKISTVIKKKAEENVYKDYDPSYKHLLMFHLLFSCLLEALNLKDEKYFKYFVNYLSGDKSKVYYDIRLDYTTMIILLYPTKREECQKKGELIYFYDFITEIKKIDITTRIKHFKKLLVMKWTHLDGRHTDYYVYCMNLRRNILECLTGKGLPINTVEGQVYKETGFMNPEVEYNKSLFRKGLRCDLNQMMKYLKDLGELFSIHVNPKMVFYFEKFVYMREYDKIVSIPEDDVCFFFFLYNLHIKSENCMNEKLSEHHNEQGNDLYKNQKEDYKKTLNKNQSINLNEYKSNLQTEILTEKIVKYLKTNKSKFYTEVHHMIIRTKKENGEFFHGKSFYYTHLLEKRFYTIQLYLKKLQSLLRNKKNMKTKKKYIESNMI